MVTMEIRVCCHGSMLCRLYSEWEHETSLFFPTPLHNISVFLQGWRIYRLPSPSWRTWQLCGSLTIRYLSIFLLVCRREHLLSDMHNNTSSHRYDNHIPGLVYKRIYRILPKGFPLQAFILKSSIYFWHICLRKRCIKDKQYICIFVHD